MRRLPVPCFDLDRRNGLVCLDVACVVELDAWSVLGAHSSGKHGPPSLSPVPRSAEDNSVCCLFLRYIGSYVDSFRPAAA